MSTATLEQLQIALKARGVKDVRFSFNTDLQSRLPSEVHEYAAMLLQSYLDGEMKPATPVCALTHIGQIG